MKIIMNPPYNGNLHLKILQEAMKHGDEIVNLSPIRWLQDPLAEYKKNSDFKKFEDIRKNITSLEKLNSGELSFLFGADFTFDAGIYYINPKAKSTYKIIKNYILDKVIKKLEPTPVSKVIDVKKDYFCLITIIDGGHRERFGESKSSFSFIRNPKWYGDYYKKGISNNGFTLQENKDRNTMSTNGNINDWVCVEFDTEDECKNYVEYTRTSFFRYLYKIEMVDVNVHPQFLPFMGDYTHPWTDEMLYEYFGLTDDEIKEIECSIK